MRALVVTIGLAGLTAAAVAGAAPAGAAPADAAEEASAAEAPLAQPDPASCQTFTRASPTAPRMVRDWLAHSEDHHVMVCPRPEPAGTAGAEPLYAGESAPARRGAVCSYSHHVLTRLGHGSMSHLQRYEAAEAAEMAPAASDCPPAHPEIGRSAYIETYDVSASAFVAIVHLWTAAAASGAAFDEALCCGAGDAGAPPDLAAARAHLRAAIDAGRMASAPVIRIVRISGTALRHRFALTVAQPDSPPNAPSLYVIYLSKPLGGAWHITGIAEAPG